MSFITIVLVIATVNLAIGYALGSAWLRVTVVHRAPAETNAYELEPALGDVMAEPSCYASDWSAEDTPSILPSCGADQDSQPVAADPADIAALCRDTAEEMRHLAELYIQRFDTINDRLEKRHGEDDASLLSEAEHTTHVTIDHWIADQAPVAERLIEVAGRVADPSGDGIGFRMEDALLEQMAQAETSLANLKYVDLQPTVGPHRVHVELDSIRESLRVLGNTIEQVTASLGKDSDTRSDSVGEHLCNA